MRDKPVWQCAHGKCTNQVPHGRNFCDDDEVNKLVKDRGHDRKDKED